MNAKQRIERDFDCSLTDIIIWLREQGCTWRTVALAFEVSRTRVYQFRERLGLEIGGRRVIDDLSRTPKKADRNAYELGYRDAGQAIVDLRAHGKTVEEVAHTLGVHRRTITRHYPPDFSGTVFVKTPRYIQSRRETGLMAVARRRARREENPEAPWRSL